jgi:hypothetical protein
MNDLMSQPGPALPFVQPTLGCTGREFPGWTTA